MIERKNEKGKVNCEKPKYPKQLEQSIYSSEYRMV